MYKYDWFSVQCKFLLHLVLVLLLRYHDRINQPTLVVLIAANCSYSANACVCVCVCVCVQYSIVLVCRAVSMFTEECLKAWSLAKDCACTKLLVAVWCVWYKYCICCIKHQPLINTRLPIYTCQVSAQFYIKMLGLQYMPDSHVYVAVRRAWQTLHVATQIRWCLVSACLTLLEQLYGIFGQLHPSKITATACSSCLLSSSSFDVVLHWSWAFRQIYRCDGHSLHLPSHTSMPCVHVHGISASK